jgi:hypothetical protein
MLTVAASPLLSLSLFLLVLSQRLAPRPLALSLSIAIDPSIVPLSLSPFRCLFIF